MKKKSPCSGRGCGRQHLPIYLVTPLNAEDEDGDAAFVNLANNAVAIYAIPPIAAEVHSQSFAISTGVFTAFKVFADPVIDHAPCLRIEFFQLFDCLWQIVYMVHQLSTSPNIFATSAWE